MQMPAQPYGYPYANPWMPQPQMMHPMQVAQMQMAQMAQMGMIPQQMPQWPQMPASHIAPQPALQQFFLR